MLFVFGVWGLGFGVWGLGFGVWAPAFVSSASVTVLLRRAVDAAAAIGGRAAKFTFLLVATVFMLLVGAVDATGAIGAGVAETAFAHDTSP